MSNTGSNNIVSEQFDEPDIATMIQNCCLGPQAEVQELIDDFNTSYLCNTNNSTLLANAKELAITKKFYWKPGAYDTIKEVIRKQGQLHKKANSLSKVIDRFLDSRWRYCNIHRSIQAIEQTLSTFRQNGTIMQDNTDDVVEAWQFIKNHLISQVEKTNDMSIRLIPVINTYDNRSEIIDYTINISYYYSDVRIKYKHSNSSEEIANITLPGYGHLTMKIKLSKLLNIIISAKYDISKINSNSIVMSNSSRNKKYLFSIGGNYESYEGIHHPYISKVNSWHSRDGIYNSDYRYVCIGNMYEEINACVQSLDFVSLKIFFDRIMTHYDTNTGPLNSLNQSYHGNPIFLDNNKEFYNIFTELKSNGYDCRYSGYLVDMEKSEIKNESYCSRYCTLTTTCSVYTNLTKELTEEEITQKALEHATLQLIRRG